MSRSSACVPDTGRYFGSPGLPAATASAHAPASGTQAADEMTRPPFALASGRQEWAAYTKSALVGAGLVVVSLIAFGVLTVLARAGRRS
ncbi:hypothetical protein ACWCXB_25520 [Streptomyces sp. NPDC001514]